VLPVRLVDADGAEVAAVTEFLLDQRACGGSIGNARSYALALLWWFRFLWAVGVVWDRAGRAEARDFMLWLEVARKPERRRMPGAPSPGSVNQVTRKPYPGVQYAVRTRRHNRAVVRAFYEYHREAGTGPMVNPMPPRHGSDGDRADAHHNPLEPFERGRRADFQYRPLRRFRGRAAAPLLPGLPSPVAGRPAAGSCPACLVRCLRLTDWAASAGGRGHHGAPARRARASGLAGIVGRSRR
jgi:hypothetical protein